MEKTRSLLLSQERHRLVGGFLSRGYDDYLSARVLLNEGLLPQGAAAAATCIEKYLKAIVALRGNMCRGHLTRSLLRSIENYDRALHASIDPRFIEFLRRAYSLRYLDDVKIGFSINISQRRTLAELDELVDRLQKKIVFHDRSGAPERLVYDRDREARDATLWTNNFVLQGLKKEEFIDQEDAIYAMLFDARMGILHFNYRTASTKGDYDWLAPGITPGRPAPKALAGG